MPFDLDDLESTFAIETTPSTSSQVSLMSPKKQNVTTLLDITRANNVGKWLLCRKNHGMYGPLMSDCTSYHAFPNQDWIV